MRIKTPLATIIAPVPNITQPNITIDITTEDEEVEWYNQILVIAIIATLILTVIIWYNRKKLFKYKKFFK